MNAIGRRLDRLEGALLTPPQSAWPPTVEDWKAARCQTAGLSPSEWEAWQVRHYRQRTGREPPDSLRQWWAGQRQQRQWAEETLEAFGVEGDDKHDGLRQGAA